MSNDIKLLGFDQDGIRSLSPHKFDQFLQVKAQMENLILSHIPIIVTTCQAAQSRGLRNINFKKVVIDEATQASEIEVLSTMMDAE